MTARNAVVIGHELVRKRLDAAAREVREKGTQTLAHALVFAGPEGIGKFQTALWWATRLKCSDAECDGTRCRECVQIAARTHPDVIIVEPETEGASIKIATVRDYLIPAMALRSMRAGPRVTIIRDAHDLTPDAQSAMLKLLEEPPGFAVLVLVTHNLAALFPTLRSRCSIVRFGRLADDEVQRLLESAGRPQAEARTAAALAGGSVGRALGFGAEAIADREQLIADYEDLRSGESADVEKLVADIADRRKNERPALDALLDWQMRKVEASLGRRTGEASDALARLLDGVAASDSTTLLDEALRTLEAVQALDRNGNPRLVLRELLLDVRPS
jgi:DNA polymerase-3 subunit delta'